MRRRPCESPQQRPVEIIGDDDPVITVAELLRGPALEIDPTHLAAGLGEPLERRHVAVDRAHHKAALEQELRMSAAAGSEVEDQTSGSDQRDKTPHPSRGPVNRFSDSGHCLR